MLKVAKPYTHTHNWMYSHTLIHWHGRSRKETSSKPVPDILVNHHISTGNFHDDSLLIVVENARGNDEEI